MYSSCSVAFITNYVYKTEQTTTGAI